MELSSQQGFSVFFFMLLLYLVSLFSFNSQNGSLKPFKSFATRSFARNSVTSIKPLPVESRLDMSEEAGSASLCVNNSFWKCFRNWAERISAYNVLLAENLINRIMKQSVRKYYKILPLTACCIHGRLFRLIFGSSSIIVGTMLLLRLVSTCCILLTG